MKLSLTMIIKNESRCIERCLKAIIPYVDMVVLCDTGSTDGTLEICKAWEDRKFFHVFSIPWEKEFFEVVFAVRLNITKAVYKYAGSGNRKEVKS